MTRRSFQKGYVFPRMTSRGKVHVIRFRIRTAEGKWKHKAETIETPRRKVARAVLAERLQDVSKGTKLPSDRTFAQFVRGEWESYLKQNLKSSTQASHRSNLSNHLLPAFCGYRLADIRALDILHLIEEKRKRGLSSKTLLNLYLLLQKMFNLAADLELISVSPVHRVPKPRLEYHEKPTLAPGQVRALIAEVPENIRALFILLYLTGLRIGEALGLKWKDVDFQRSKLYIRRSIWSGQEQSPKSRRSVRAKHLVETLASALQRHKELSFYTEPEFYVFANGAGKPRHPDDLRKRILYSAMDRAGIKRTVSRGFGFHLFRHSAGTEMHEATGNLKQTQSFLGHSGISVTGDVYLHLQPDAEIEAMRKLERAVFPDLCSTVLKNPTKEPSNRVN